jgi:hypothetical protein
MPFERLLQSGYNDRITSPWGVGSFGSPTSAFPQTIEMPSLALGEGEKIIRGGRVGTAGGKAAGSDYIEVIGPDGKTYMVPAIEGVKKEMDGTVKLDRQSAGIRNQLQAAIVAERNRQLGIATQPAQEQLTLDSMKQKMAESKAATQEALRKPEREDEKLTLAQKAEERRRKELELKDKKYREGLSRFRDKEAIRVAGRGATAKTVAALKDGYAAERHIERLEIEELRSKERGDYRDAERKRKDRLEFYDKALEVWDALISKIDKDIAIVQKMRLSPTLRERLASLMKQRDALETDRQALLKSQLNALRKSIGDQPADGQGSGTPADGQGAGTPPPGFAAR